MTDIEVVAEMLKSGEGLTREGIPKVSELEKRLGREISNTERAKLVKQAQVLNDKPAVTVIADAAPAVRKSIVTSGCGGW